VVNEYFKIGFTPEQPSERSAYFFVADGTLGPLGASFFDDDNNGLIERIVLHLRDGDIGDNDVTANGIIVDPGGPELRHPPLALGNAYEIDEDGSVRIPGPGLLANDPSPTGDPLTAVLVTGPMHGTLALRADGSFDYTPARDFDGTDTFTYKANDGRLDSEIATVTVRVNPVDDEPPHIESIVINDGSAQRSKINSIT